MVDFKANIAANIAKAQSQMFAQTMERAQLQIKLALTQKHQERLAKINDKYDGRAAAEVENKINELVAKKEKYGVARVRLDTALKKLNTIREKLYELQDLADPGTKLSFDTKLKSINDEVGSSVFYKDKLLGNPGRNGGWGIRTTILDDSRTKISYQTAFLGSDYYVDLDTGERMGPEMTDRVLQGGPNGDVNFDDISSVNIVGDAITFSAGADNYSGTIRFGGLGVGNSWAYNNFDAAGITQLSTDISTAIEKIAEVELSYRQSLSKIKLVESQITGDTEVLSNRYTQITEEELTAKQAERRALTARHDMTINTMALTASTQTAFIQNMFFAEDPFKKTSVFGILQKR